MRETANLNRGIADSNQAALDEYARRQAQHQQEVAQAEARQREY
jgi:hypothetical protein